MSAVPQSDPVSGAPASTPPAFRELPRYLLAILFIALLLATSVWILRPFLSALIWATLLVVATWPLMLAVQKRLGGKRSLAVTVMTSVMLLVVILPLALAVLTIAGRSDDIADKAKALAQAGIPAPPDWVEKIPLAGPRVVGKWRESDPELVGRRQLASPVVGGVRQRATSLRG